MTSPSNSAANDGSIARSLILNDQEYLEMPGLNVMLAHDYYPESHQGGVGFIQNGLRVATNGDLRLEPTPGQWSPVPKVGQREIDRPNSEISVRMSYPDEAKDKKGFNPIDYPDLRFSYRLRVRPEGHSFRISVDLEAPLPAEWIGKVGFNLEIFPGYFFGKTYSTGTEFGVFARQPSGSLGAKPSLPIASGMSIVIAPEAPELHFQVDAEQGGPIQLIDGRDQHNNGWFVLRSLIEAGTTVGAIEWIVRPNVIEDWKYQPAIQVSQVGYHPAQTKVAVIEMDPQDTSVVPVELLRISPKGGMETVLSTHGRPWGAFLRYHYLQFDFSGVREPGMYVVKLGEHQSSPFKIASSVFTHGVWQPTVEYFLPVQMCHMRVNENYRVWHGLCHMDDAVMAPVDFNHIDGYIQGPSTRCSVKSGEHLPSLAVGGWHDAGDYDLRVESQADTVHGLALAYEEFGLDYDNTTVDQLSRTVELLVPDGKPDILQQIEHGCLSIVAGYNALGRLYRGIIEPTLRQYTHLGDAATVTDNKIGTEDDRLVFTEDNPRRELEVAGALACAARLLRGFNDALGLECLRISEELYSRTETLNPLDRFEVSVELYLTTKDDKYRESTRQFVDLASESYDRFGWLIARALLALKMPVVPDNVRHALEQLHAQDEAREKKTPYGLPYQPDIWGAGWGIQRYGVQRYWLHKAMPALFSPEHMLHAVNFILGCHPGSNPASFVSGVGVRSMIPGYGVNRADNSYIPGGIGSGTALIRPDFPEFLEWPYLWQQTEYCVGYSTSDYVFLIAAADHVLNQKS